MEKYIEVPLEIKSDDISDNGIFSGYASTFGGKADSYGDVIVEGAFTDSIRRGGRNGNGVAMLWQHDYTNPIGVWTDFLENKTGLKVTGQLALKAQKGADAYELMKIGALKGLSIGWDFQRDEHGKVLADAYEYDEKKKKRYLKKIDLWEISPVTFPANTRATITSVKSLVENAKNERELESALRDECNLSHNAAKYIVSLCKDKLQREAVLNDIDAKKRVESIVEQLEQLRYKGVVPFKSYTLDDESASWSGSDEIRKAEVKDLKIMSTWYDSDEPDVEASYKLPHHRANGYKTVWRGVAAAMAALLGARGGVDIPDGDRKGVYNHLVKHYKEFGKTPPDFR